MPAEGIAPAIGVRRAANVRVRRLVEELAGEPSSDGFRFFCECDEPACTALVELRATEFDAVVREGRARILAAGHAT